MQGNVKSTQVSKMSFTIPLLKWNNPSTVCSIWSITAAPEILEPFRTLTTSAEHVDRLCRSGRTVLAWLPGIEVPAFQSDSEMELAELVALARNSSLQSRAIDVLEACLDCCEIWSNQDCNENRWYSVDVMKEQSSSSEYLAPPSWQHSSHQRPTQWPARRPQVKHSLLYASSACAMAAGVAFPPVPTFRRNDKLNLAIITITKTSSDPHPLFLTPALRTGPT